jgi:hypothetical protein
VDATIEEQGKLSSCYEKNISQDTTCRKVFVIGCTEKVLGGLGVTEVCGSVLKKISEKFGRKEKIQLSCHCSPVFGITFFM